MRIASFIFGLITALNLSSQIYVTQEYYSFKLKADSLFEKNEYHKAAKYFSLAFKEMGIKSIPDDRYRAATSWAMAGFVDSAFAHLELLIKINKYSEYETIRTDTLLKSLSRDSRWSALLKKVKANMSQTEKKYNQKLIFMIDSMEKLDQKWRMLLVKLSNNEIDSLLYSRRLLMINVRLTDSLNYFLCKKIIKKYGFPNYEIVGEEASHNFWLLVQHQDANVSFQNDVLKKMKIEVDKGLASKVDYAYLLDRVRVNTNQFQVYGTQMILNADGTSFIPKPVIDEPKLNERRKSMGLNSIEEYIKIMNSNYHGDLRK